MATTVVMAVRLTERAKLPFANWQMKLEMLPPGQAATSIIPKAILGCGLKAQTNRKVRNGNSKNCDAMPVRVDLGSPISRLKSDQ